MNRCNRKRRMQYAHVLIGDCDAIGTCQTSVQRSSSLWLAHIRVVKRRRQQQREEKKAQTSSNIARSSPHDSAFISGNITQPIRYGISQTIFASLPCALLPAFDRILSRSCKLCHIIIQCYYYSSTFCETVMLGRTSQTCVFLCLFFFYFLLSHILFSMRFMDRNRCAFSKQTKIEDCALLARARLLGITFSILPILCFMSAHMEKLFVQHIMCEYIFAP